MTDTLLVQQSYGRCCMAEGFFDDFYTAFVNKSPVIAEKFAHTDMAKQKQLLRQGITYMLMYYKNSKLAGSKISSIAETHARGHFSIAPEMYNLWLETLLETIAAHEPMFDEKLKTSWQNVMLKGIQAMAEKY
jgi:hemoglobin-like flavoprotein